MTLDRSQLFLAGFATLVAWGIAVRLAPVLWHLANAFFIGALSTILVLLWLNLTTIKGFSSLPPRRSRAYPAFTLPTAWPTELARYNNSLHYEAMQLYPTSLTVSKSLDQLIDLALREFIGSWYKNISSRPCFLHEIDRHIRIAAVELRDRVLREDLVGMLVARILPIITNHLHEFENAERTIKSRALQRNLPESDELDLAIAGAYRDGKLHPAASLTFSDTKSPQQEHMRKILVRVLPLLLDDSMVRSRTVLILVKEIVACAVLFPILQLLADSDTWNQIVEAYGTTTLQDRKTVRRMRAALDEHTSTAARKQLPAEIPRLQPLDSERAFERFVRTIRKTETLADARRFRNQIASQLARERQVEGQDPVYLRRLEMGKRVLDQKIAKTTKLEVAVNGSTAGEVDTDRPVRASNWTVVDIMHTSSGLSYFMEFMERQKKMAFVQFWVVVDGFRNPLEDDFGDEKSSATVTWTNTDRLDIAQIAEIYILKSDLNVPKELQDGVQDFLQAGRRATPEQYRTARMAILSAQSAVLEELEQKYWPKFCESDLFYKFLASDEGRAVRKSRHSIDANGTSTTESTSPRPRTYTPPISRISSQAQISKPRDLRRAALSSSDVKGLATLKASDEVMPVRRSLDVDRPLFDDEYDNDPLSLSIQSIGNDSTTGDPHAEPEVIENMEAALNTIMSQSPITDVTDLENDTLFGAALSPQTFSRPSLDTARSGNAVNARIKPSLATLGLVNTSGRIGVFRDNDLFGDEAKFVEDEYADHGEEHKDQPDEEIHQAAPSDLGLTEAITVLSDDIERLVSQEAVVDTLTRKAELTNNVAELRILGKSKASLQREIRRKELQRQQYIVQESDNSLYGRASINIESVMVGREDDGQEYAVYIIKVRRHAGDQLPATSWAIAHRYSEFHSLHQRLRRRYPSTRNMDFPRRRVVLKLQKQFLHGRRLALEAWLQQLLRMPDVCRSREFRSFLSQQAISQPKKNDSTPNSVNTQDMVTRIYNSVTNGMDDFLGNVAVLDQLSVAGQNLISAATSQMTSPMPNTVVSSTSSSDDVIIQPGSIAEAEAELRAFEDKELAPFVKPICDIFLEIFELNRGNNWLRGRAVVVVIHQLLGGTVERKVRDSFSALFSESALLRYIEKARTTMWPSSDSKDSEAGSTGNQSEEVRKRTPNPPRTKAQKDHSRREAALVLSSLIPELAGSVVGRANAQSAARRLAAVMNNKRLNEHLVCTVLDEMVGFLFDEVSFSGRHGSKDKPKKKAK
ncbi:tRNA (guanine-N(7)-)-methyltransferase (tRNA(m7G46)-methyltransferase) [Lithohypha guttulata]|nr:tRNA (guanine-N(7)-)-methyltransferase (tRNA(m7G46)-methyltransferase) [Lithohypha guttulata]